MKLLARAFIFAGMAGFWACAATAQESAPPPLARAHLQTQAPAPHAPSTFNSDLVFDAELKEYSAKTGEAFAPFSFALTNRGSGEIVIDSVKPSCGCTTVNMPAVPWHLAAGAAGKVEAKVALAGKMGTLTKTLTFNTSAGSRVVSLRVQVPSPARTDGRQSDEDRRVAMMKASQNAQAIFAGSCVECHVAKGEKKLGEELYAADCGICHESSHRESIVPDLHALKQAADLDYWRAIITFGKPHSLMPGFGREQGGPLSPEQITSLASYLDRTISHHFKESASR